MTNKKCIFLFPIFSLCAVLLTLTLTFYDVSKNYAEKDAEKKLTKTEARKFIFEDIQKCSDAFWSGNADIHPDCAKQREEYMNQHYFGESNVDVFNIIKEGLEKFYQKNTNGGFQIDSVIQSHFITDAKQDYKNYGDSDDSIYNSYSIKYSLKLESDFPIVNQKACEIFKKSFNKELYLKNLDNEFGQDYFPTNAIYDPSLWLGDPDYDLFLTCLHWPRWGQEFGIGYNQNNDIHFIIKEGYMGYPY
ncbi:MAG: hypothetical protein V1770_04635 [bacterium]